MEECSIWRNIEHCKCQRGLSASWIAAGFSKKSPFFFFVMHGLHYFMAALHVSVSVRTVGEHNSCVWPRVYSFVFVTY